jgi:major vault protein
MSKKLKDFQDFGEGGMSTSVFRVPPYHYIHVQDQTTNVTRIEIGPLTFVRKDNEKVVSGPAKMIIVPPRHYCIVHNPVVRSQPEHDSELGEVQFDAMGQIRLYHAETEVRLVQDPFPLYPGEEAESVKQLTVVPAMQALRLRAVREFIDENKINRVAGDEFLFEGPGTYIPRKEVEIVNTFSASIIYPNEALQLRATRATVDRDGKSRVAGEEWMVRKVGAYLPGAHEMVVQKCTAIVLTEKTAAHVIAKRSFTDQLGVDRKTGEEYLITLEDMESFIPGVYEQVKGTTQITTLTNRQYCVVLNPIGDDGKPQLGHRKVVKGEKSFFLQPGELLESGIEDIYILGDDEGIVLRSLVEYEDKQTDQSQKAVHRKPGDMWMLKGPMEYIPTVEVEVVTTRKAIPLHENEGIYVRNIKSGSVRSVIGHSYMLKVRTLLAFNIL